MDPSLPFPAPHQEPGTFISRLRCGIYHLARHSQYQIVRVDPEGVVGEGDRVIRSIRVPP